MHFQRSRAFVQLWLVGLALASPFAAHAQVSKAFGSITTQNLVAAGTATTGSCVEISAQDKGVIGVGVSGTYTGALSAQATVNGSLWSTLGPTPFAPATALGTPTATITSAATGNWQVSAVPGWQKFRVCGLAAMTGTASIALVSSPASIGSSGGGSSGGAITAASGALASGSVSSGAFASGALASGSVASGAFAAGSLASGAGVDGWDLTQGAKADSVCATDTGTCTVTALLKKANANLTTLAGTNTDLTAVQTPVAPATATATKANLAGLQYNSTPPTFTNGQQGSLQGDANGYLKVNVAAGSSSGTVAQASTTSGQSGMLVQGAVTTSAPSYTTAQTSPLSLDTSGNLRVSGSFSASDVGSFTGTCSSSCNGTTLVAWTTDGYQSAEVQVTSAGTGATFSWQCSSDNVTFAGCNAMAPSSTGSSGVASASTGALGQFCMPVYARYQRVQMTGYSSGTVTVVGYQRSKANCGGVVASINVVNTVTTSTSGSVAQGGTAANPLGMGLEARTTSPTATTSGQMTRVQGTTDGKQVTLIGGVPELSWTYAAATSGISNTTTAVTIKAAGTDRLYLTRLDLMCEALGTATEVAVRDGAGGTVLWRTKVGTGGLPLANISFATPLKGTSATLMEVVTLTASGTGACYFNAAGYDAK